MADDLDLSGKQSEQDAEAKKKPGKQEASGAAKVYTRPDRAERVWQKDLRTRLERTFERMAEWREGRGDEELARVFREDAPAMIGGVIAIATPLEWIRPVLVMGLTVVEPLLAFGRLARVLLGRLGAARNTRTENALREWEAAQQALAQEQPGGVWLEDGTYLPPEPQPDVVG